MKHYAGLDVSMKETFVCVVDENGERVIEKEISTDPKTIANFLKGLGLGIQVVGLESGSLSHWLTDELLKLDLPVKCIDARHIAAILSVKVNKTDRNDARGIADAMRCNFYKEVVVKNKQEIEICTLLNSRKHLGGTAVSRNQKVVDKSGCDVNKNGQKGNLNSHAGTHTGAGA